jgi:hypothetical protein
VIAEKVKAQSRAASGRGAAMQQDFYSVYFGQIAVKSD